MILEPLSIVHHVGRSLKYGSQLPRHGQRSAILKTPSFLGTGPFQAFLLSSMETTERPVLVIGIDDSSHSFYALEWTLDHFFSSPKTKPFKLVIVYARPPASSVVGFAGPGKTIVFSPFGSQEKNGNRSIFLTFFSATKRRKCPKLEKAKKNASEMLKRRHFGRNMSVWCSSLQGYLIL
ncbi:hypothetical protein VitviT2T_006308 [Vitis vinifera]|uniref:UspA domain-containing protein n=1 Tax=Vitis vinifera TaxID=29760 RepID=A0ABY9BVM2_VITVI|nr:hypothetical protein VitviT2T_006308 [Vitis vinifera]